MKPFELTEKNKKEIRALFDRKPISAPVLEKLCQTIEHLCTMNPRFNRAESMSEAAVVKLVEDMRKHVKAALDIKQKLDSESDLNPIDIDGVIADECKNAVDFLESPINGPVYGMQSRTQDLLMQMWMGLVIQGRNLKQQVVPSKPKVFTHAQLINGLITFFLSEVPNIKPSKSRDSVFEKLIRYILNDIVKHPTTNAQTHIRNAYDARASLEDVLN